MLLTKDDSALSAPRRAAVRFALCGVVAGLLVAACGAIEDDTPALGVAGPRDTPPSGGKPRDGGGLDGSSGASGTSGSPAPDVCSRKYTSVPAAGLTACGEGKGHCYDKDKTPVLGQLPECNETQWCVPDGVLAAGGQPLKSCNSGYGDGAGACVSTLLKEIADSANQLGPDVCTPGELCAPCVYQGRQNPACTGVGVYDRACVGELPDANSDAEPPNEPLDAGPIELASCCVWPFGQQGGIDYPAGKCVPQGALTPAQQQANFPQNTCNASFVCAPNELVAGQNLRVCYWDEGWFGDDGNGVCIDRCFIGADKYEDLDYIYTGGCQTTEFCVPCRELPAGTPGCGG